MSCCVFAPSSSSCLGFGVFLLCIYNCAQTPVMKQCHGNRKNWFFSVYRRLWEENTEIPSSGACLTSLSPVHCGYVGGHNSLGCITPDHICFSVWPLGLTLHFTQLSAKFGSSMKADLSWAYFCLMLLGSFCILLFLGRGNIPAFGAIPGLPTCLPPSLSPHSHLILFLLPLLLLFFCCFLFLSPH